MLLVARDHRQHLCTFRRSKQPFVKLCEAPALSIILSPKAQERPNRVQPVAVTTVCKLPNSDSAGLWLTTLACASGVPPLTVETCRVGSTVVFLWLVETADMKVKLPFLLNLQSWFPCGGFVCLLLIHSKLVYIESLVAYLIWGLSASISYLWENRVPKLHRNPWWCLWKVIWLCKVWRVQSHWQVYRGWLDYMYITPTHPGRYCDHRLVLLNPNYPSKLSFTDWAVVEASSEDLPILHFSLHD